LAHRLLGRAWAQADSCSSSSGKTCAEHDVQNAGAFLGHFLGMAAWNHFRADWAMITLFDCFRLILIDID